MAGRYFEDPWSAQYKSDTEGSSTSGRLRRPHRQPRQAWPTDAEGVRDVYKDALNSAYKSRNARLPIDFDLIQDECIDWLAEKDVLQVHLTRISQQHCFMPRLGELVLWFQDVLPQHIFLARNGAGYELFDLKVKKFIGKPRWKGGIVTELPSHKGKNGIDFSDLLSDPVKTTDRNISGFRIETMVDVNKGGRKSTSKQYKYVSLKQIRPLSHWQHILAGFQQEDLHMSVLNALKCMTSISPVNAYKFQGKWTEGGYFRSRAMYLGSELIIIGDAIRLVPEVKRNGRTGDSYTSQLCTDVMTIEEIRINIEGLNVKHFESHSDTICTQHHITFVGVVYSLTSNEDVPNDSHRIVDGETLKHLFRPVGTGEYGSWRRIGKVEVSYDQVIGRLYEADAIKLWSGQLQTQSDQTDKEVPRPALSFDLAGVLAARQFATAADDRISKLGTGGIRWLISDSRAQGLALRYINGLEVMEFDPIRTELTRQTYRYHALRAQNKTITADMLSKKRQKAPTYVFDDQLFEATNSTGKKRGRPTGSKLINGKLFTAAQLDKNPEILSTAKRTMQASIQSEIIEISDSDSDELPSNSQPSSQRRSQMAQASLHQVDRDTDSDLLQPIKLEDGAKLNNTNTLPVMQRRPPGTVLNRNSHNDGQTSPSEDDSDEDWADLSKAQGGTDESENGDYDPMID